MTSSLGGDLPDWNRKVANTDDVLLGTWTLASGAFSPNIDVSQYTSLVVTMTASDVTQTHSALLHWVDPDGNQLFVDSVGSRANVTPPSATVPVRGQGLIIQPVTSGGTMTFKVWGSQRAQSQMLVQAFPGPITAQLNQTFAANNLYTFGVTAPQGECQVDVVIGGATFTGEFIVQYLSVGGLTISQRWLDTTEFHVMSVNNVWHGRVIFPADDCELFVLCRAGATTTITVNMYAIGR